MALTLEQQRRLQEVIKEKAAQKPTAAPSSLTPDQQARLDAIVKERTPAAEVKKEGILARAAGTINRGVEGFGKLPVIKQLGQATGAALAGPSALIGGAVGAVGTPIANIAQGKPVFQGLGAGIIKSAKDTGKFAYDIGSQAPTVAAMGTLGRVPNLLLGAAQGYEGVKQTREALKSGDRVAATEAGITTGLGILGTALGLKAKGNILSREFTAPIKAKVKGTTVPEMRLKEAETVIRDVLQPTKATAKQEAKGLLQEARQERHGMSVEPRQPVERTAAQRGIIPGHVNEGGSIKFDTVDNVKQWDELVESTEDILQTVLARDPNPKFSLSKIKQQALDEIDAMKDTLEIERDAMKAEVIRHFDPEIAKRGDFVNGGDLNQIKRGFAKLGDYKNLSPLEKHMRKTAEIIRKDIELGYKNNADVHAVNRVLGDYIEARTAFQNLHNTVIKGGNLGRRLAGLAGAAASSGIPVIGNIPIIREIVGFGLGSALNDYSISPARRTAGAMRNLAEANYKAPQAGILKKAQEQSQAAALRQSQIPRLEAPKPNRVRDYEHPKQGKSQILSQEEAVLRLQEMGVDPYQRLPRVHLGDMSKFEAKLRESKRNLLLPAPGQGTKITDYPIEFSRNIPDTTPSPLYEFPPSPQPKTAEQIRLETFREQAKNLPPMTRLQETAPRSTEGIQVMPRMMDDVRISRPVNLLEPKVDTVSEQMKLAATQSQKKQIFEQYKKAVLESMTFPEKQMETAYERFRKYADRSSIFLDPQVDAATLKSKKGKLVHDAVIENAASGGVGGSNDEILELFRERYVREKKLRTGEIPNNFIPF